MTRKDRPAPTLFDLTPEPEGLKVFARCPECSTVRLIALSIPGRDHATVEQIATQAFCTKCEATRGLVRTVLDHTEPWHPQTRGERRMFGIVEVDHGETT